MRTCVCSQRILHSPVPNTFETALSTMASILPANLRGSKSEVQLRCAFSGDMNGGTKINAHQPGKLKGS